MVRTNLTAATLGQLADGYLGKLIDKALREIQSDLDDRGDDKQTRALDLKLVFKPAGGGSNQVTVVPKVTVKLPALVPPVTVGKLDKVQNGIMFNPENASNPDQKTFADKLADDGEVAE